MVPFSVLHYVGAKEDRGGILTVVRQLAGAGLGRAVVSVAPEFQQTRMPRLRLLSGAGPEAETISLPGLCSAAGVAWRLRLALARRRRIFHGHSRAGLLVGLWLRLLGAERVVVSVHCHGRQTWFYRWAALVLGGRLVWLTPAMKAHYDVGARTWLGCRPNFLNATKAERMLWDRAVHRVEGGESVLRLGGIGALVPWKGWHFVIDALGRLSPGERARVEFWHIGTTENSEESRNYAAHLLTLAATLGVASRVHWRGEQSSSAPLLAEVDALVIPSESEPFSMALLEAWRAGVPVLAADGGGPGELIAEGRDGWLFASGSTEALAQRISTLLRAETWREVQPELPSAEPAIARWRAIYAEVLA